MEMEEKKSRRCRLKYRRGSGGKVWRAWEKEMQNWNRFQICAAMPCATFPKLSHSASLFPRQEDSQPFPRWLSDLGALTQPSRGTQHPLRSSPRPECGSHSPAPSNTPRACSANLYFGKGQDVVVALHRCPSEQRLLWHKGEERTTEPHGKLPGCAAASSSYAQRDLKSSITLIFNRVTFNEL